MGNVHVLAIDLAKRSFQVCATDRGGAVLYNRMMTRAKLEQHLRSLAPGIVAMEACATSHFWGRFALSLGHEVRLIPPICVKPFVRRQKNDAADAAAIAEAALQPNMHYVPVKSAEHQARAVAFRTHQCFVGQWALQGGGHSPARTVAKLRGRGVRHADLGRLVQQSTAAGAHRQHPASRSRGTLLRHALRAGHGGVI